MTDTPDPDRLLRPITEEAFALLGDETRRRIVFLLRDSELTVKEIASRLGLTTQNIYHHIGRLQEAGLVRVIDERLVGRLLERYYTVTADTFIYNEDKMEENDYQSSFDVLNGLNELGIDVIASEENAVRLALMDERRLRGVDIPSIENDVCTFCSFSGFFMKFGPLNPVLLSRILQYSDLMSITEEEFEKSLKLIRQLRGFLLSIRNQ